MDRQHAASLLGVGVDANSEVVRNAYRQRARALHPDAGATDHAAMAELNLAYRVLRQTAPSSEAGGPAPFDEVGSTVIDGDEYDDDLDGALHPPDALALLRVGLVALGLLMVVVMFVVAIGFDWSLGR